MLLETVSAIGSAITGAIRQAAQATGTGFGYLLATAKIESNLNPQIKASTSSATGLFQFIDQTWLMTMKQAGAELGYGRYAEAIERTSTGRYVVRDPGRRAEILNLRKDPAINAAMAGAFTRQNAAHLKTRLGRDATDGELYMAHFLGAGGATKLISAAARKPGVKAAELFPRAAAANRAIFYDKRGTARSASAVYGLLATKLARAMPAQSPSRVAEPARAMPVQATAAVHGLLSPARTSAVMPAIPLPPLAESVAPLMFAQSQASPSPTPAEPKPEVPVASRAAGEGVFHDLFRTEGRGAVSQAVSELWGARTASAVPPKSAIAPAPRSSGAELGQGFDLFRSPRPPT